MAYKFQTQTDMAQFIIWYKTDTPIEKVFRKHEMPSFIRIDNLPNELPKKLYFFRYWKKFRKDTVFDRDGVYIYTIIDDTHTHHTYFSKIGIKIEGVMSREPE